MCCVRNWSCSKITQTMTGILGVQALLWDWTTAKRFKEPLKKVRAQPPKEPVQGKNTFSKTFSDTIAPCKRILADLIKSQECGGSGICEHNRRKTSCKVKHLFKHICLTKRVRARDSLLICCKSQDCSGSTICRRTAEARFFVLGTLCGALGLS